MFIGYGVSYEYFLIVQLEVKNFIDSYLFEIGIFYYDLVIVIIIIFLCICEGDLGSFVYFGNIIYVIYIVGGFNLFCINSEGSFIWLLELSLERVYWIEFICKKGWMFDFKILLMLEGMSFILFSKE